MSAGAVAAGGLAVVGAADVKLAAEAEQTQVAFETMLGSATKAQSLIGDLRDFAEKTSFGESEILGSAKSLLAFGVNAKSIEPELRRIGDIGFGVTL